PGRPRDAVRLLLREMPAQHLPRWSPMLFGAPLRSGALSIAIPVEIDGPAITSSSIPWFDTEENRHAEAQPFVGDQRRRRRHRVGAPHHGQGRIVEGLVAGTLHNVARHDTARPVELEFYDNLRTLLRPVARITLVFVQMGGQ